MPLVLGKLEHVDPRQLWNNEAANFTPWLAANLPLLGEALSLDIELVQMERAVGDFACDIEARDANSNRPVVIENQLAATDHRHLGQLLTYASGLDAAIVVWISTEIRDEHRQALDWLNRHTDDQVDFFGVMLEAIKIDNSNPAVQFTLAAYPNKEWRRTAAPGVSDRNLAYKEFFQPLIDELRETHRFTNAKAAQPLSWYSFGAGISGISYGASFARGNRLRAEVYINTGDTIQNKAIFDALLQHKKEVQAQLGELSWERLPNRQACRIAAVRQNMSVADAATEGNEMRAWLVDRLLRLKAVFGPLIPDAIAAAAPALADEVVTDEVPPD